MRLAIDAWNQGAAIPAKYAFGQIPVEGRFELGGNISPAMNWTDVPEDTRSFALLCHDPDVPCCAEDANQEGKILIETLPRMNFYHWVLINIPANKTGFIESEASTRVTPRGKNSGQKPYGVAGINGYTDWFSGDNDMEGSYADYDGPCPPWNDSIIHHYHFTLYALDIEKLEVPEPFDGPTVFKTIRHHILDQASYVGTYTMNRDSIQV